MRRPLLPLLLLLGLSLPVGAQAATIWTGPTVSFTKTAFADPSDPANRDILIPGVVELTRGTVAGIYNFAQEGFYSSPSPADTEWAFVANNGGLTLGEITASNFANLSFDDWITAHGSNPPATVGQPAVLHIISADIYLDVMFTAWGIGSGAGGSFSYERSTIPEPSTAVLLGLGLAALARRRQRRAQPAENALRRPLLPLFLLFTVVLPVCAQAATIWTGPTISFTKAPFADPNDPANRDLILPGVVEITRGNIEGIYNRAREGDYGFSSPADTEWAFVANNGGLELSEITASNFTNLSFATWRVANGENPPSTVGQPAVLHIISADIYIDVMFTSWSLGQDGGGGGGGGFSYQRSTIPEPSTAALVAIGLAVLAARRQR